LLLALSLGAQTVDIKPFKAIKPRSLGPAGMSGRITAIDVVNSQPQIIYAGSASGGVWKSESGGISWTPIFDDQPIQSIGAIAINQSNPSEIWVGTGEGNPRNSQNFGLGIFKSLDGGKTWKNMGLKETKTIHRIIIHRDNPNIVYVGAQGSTYGPNEERGVYRTKDGGKTWERVLFVNNQTGVGEMVVDPSNPNKLIVNMWEYGRKPWTFNSGGAGSGLYVTHDGGDTWERRSSEDGLPKGQLGRMGLAISRSKPNIVYALIEAKDNGLYKSTDGGKKWSLVASKNIGDRPFYYAEIYADPQNENRLWNIFSLVTKSEDGGKTFETVLPYSGVHPDHHAFWIHPENPNYVIDGNDGGLNISHDGGKNWRFVDNIPVGQFYHIAHDMSVPYKVGGGMQDNGSWVGPNAIWQAGGLRNAVWQEVFFGDGFDLGFRPDNSRYVYAMSQGGNLGYIDTETGKSSFVKPTAPNGEDLRFNWNAAFAQDPHNNCGVYYGSQFVHYSKDCGQSWEIISPDLTTNDTSKQKPHLSGGLTIDATNAENHTTILAIAPSPVDAKVIWVGTDDGNLQLTRDGGKTWSNLISRMPGYNPGSWIPYIEVSARNAGEVFVVVNDYRRNDWRPMVYHSADYGQTFTKIVDENKVQGFCLSIVQDPQEPKHLWLGTDHGLFFSIDYAKTWTKWTNGFPSVPVADMKIHPRENDLVIATFGRSLWVFDDIRPFREMARTGGQVLQQELKIFPTQDAYLAASKSYQGLHFPGDGLFEGTNKAPGAWLTLWNKAPAKAAAPATPATPPAPAPAVKNAKKGSAPAATPAPAPSVPAPAAAKKPERVKIIILSGNDTIRTFSTRLDTGLTRVYWPLNRNGTRFPNRQEARPDDGTPSGPAVLPGTYKVVAVLGKFKDSTTVTVKADPRLPFDPNKAKAKDATFREMEKVTKAATAGFEQLRDARNSIKRVDAALANAPDSTKQSLAKMAKALQDSINNIERLYMEPEDIKGIQRDDDNLMSALFGAQQYINASDDGGSQGAQRMIAAARKKTTAILNRINNLMNGKYADYRKKVEAVQFSLFKAAAPLKIE
jgi:photosystem II stability/assembly factor-like uncharacterized protein